MRLEHAFDRPARRAVRGCGLALAVVVAAETVAVAAPVLSGVTDLEAPLGPWRNGAARAFTAIGWTISWSDARVRSVDWTPRAGDGGEGGYDPTSGNGTRANLGLLRLDLDYLTLDPITFTFLDVSPGTAVNPEPKRRGLGLRFDVNVSALNSSGDLWESFAMKLVDPDPQPAALGGGSRDHPDFPHFHNGVSFTSDPLSYASGGGTPLVRSSTGFLNFGQGVEVVIPTGSFTGNVIGIHDYEVNGIVRRFDYVLQPRAVFTQPPVVPPVVPEPSGLAMLASGFVGLGLTLARRRRSRGRNRR